MKNFHLEAFGDFFNAFTKNKTILHLGRELMIVSGKLFRSGLVYLWATLVTAVFLHRSQAKFEQMSANKIQLVR